MNNATRLVNVLRKHKSDEAKLSLRREKRKQVLRDQIENNAPLIASHLKLFSEIFGSAKYAEVVFNNWPNEKLGSLISGDGFQKYSIQLKKGA